jgi:PIN domain
MLHIFPDTNALLHFKRPDRIDWPTLLGTKPITLVVTPVLIRELEEQKVTNSVRKLRERAQAVLHWFATFIDASEPVGIRADVHLAFIRTSPILDFKDHRLSSHLADDELIATVIEFRNEKKADVKIVTADLGMRLKLPAHKIPSFMPPDSERLPAQLDETEKELEQLRREAERQQNRRPKLLLTFADGREFTQISMMEAVQAHRAINPASLPAYFVGTASKEDFANYLRELSAWKSAVGLLSPCDLKIINDGTLEATEIEIELLLPEFVGAIHDDDFPDEPDPPSTIFDPYPSFGKHKLLGTLIAPRSVTRAYITGTGLSFRLPTIVHNRGRDLDRFYFQFASSNVIQNFSLSFNITCREALDPIEGKLNVIVVK